MTESFSLSIEQEGRNAGFVNFVREPASTSDAQVQLESIGYTRVSANDIDDLMTSIDSPDETQPFSVLFVCKLPSDNHAFAFQIFPIPQERDEPSIQHNLLNWREETNDSFLMVKWEETEFPLPLEP